MIGSVPHLPPHCRRRSRNHGHNSQNRTDASSRGACGRLPRGGNHWRRDGNNAKLHSNDEDRIAGTGDIWRLADFCYAAIDTGYDGWFGEDQFTYRTDPIKSMALSRELFGNVMKKALLIYAIRNKLEKAQSTGDAVAAIELVKRYIF